MSLLSNPDELKTLLPVMGDRLRLKKAVADELNSVCTVIYESSVVQERTIVIYCV